MLVRDAVRAVKMGTMPKTVVLWGDEAYIRKVGERELVKAAAVVYPEMNVAIFEGRPNLGDLEAALGRIPFASPTKVVVLRDTDILSTGASTDLSKPLSRAPLEEHTLFIISAPGKLDKRKDYVKHLMGSALMVECASLAGEALRKCLVAEAKARGLIMGRAAAEMLADRTQGDLHAAMNELDKLSSVAVGEISVKDIEVYTPAPPEADVFRIHDLFVQGRTEEAMREVNALLEEDPTPIGFLTMLGNSFRQMLVARACRDAKFTQRRTIDCICQETGAREWVAKRAYDRASHFTAQKLRENVELMSEVDFGAKQGIYVLASDLYGLLARLYATG